MKHKLLIPLILLVCAGLVYGAIQFVNHSNTAQAASISSAQSGPWSDPAIWEGGQVPKDGDTVRISSGHTVIYDVQSEAVLAELTIQGTLYFSRDTDTRLRTNGNIIVQENGFLNMGTPDDYIPRNVKAEVVWNLTQEQADAYVPVTGHHVEPRSPGLYALPQSRWEVHGEPHLRTWSKLAQDAQAGATSVVVENDVTDWYAGGRVVVSGTSNPLRWSWSESRGREVSNSVPPEHEVRSVKSIDSLSNGRTRVTLDQPLQHSHEGTAPFQGEVGLLTRNVVFKTELQGVSASTLFNDVRTRKFAHTMYMPNAKGDL